MADEWDVVDLWVCLFPSADAVEASFAERYDQEDGVPISAFAADMGVWFYDHDFVYREFHEPPARMLEEALGRWDHLAWAHPQMLQAFRDSTFSPFNLFLVAFGREIEHPKSMSSAGRTLHYLGRFENPAADRPVA